ncbi:DUF6559 family protein [Agarivorans sp. MS3-6]
MFNSEQKRLKRALERLHCNLYPTLSSEYGHKVQYSLEQVQHVAAKAELDESLIPSAIALFCFTLEDLESDAEPESGYELYLELRREINTVAVELGLATIRGEGEYSGAPSIEAYSTGGAGYPSDGGSFDGGGGDSGF